VGIVFGYFTTFCNYCVSFLPTPENLIVRFLMMAVSAVLVAIGIFLYVPANIMPLAGEGIMQVISDLSHVAFSKVKMGFDISMVVISLVTCLLLLHALGSVGVGTIITSVLVGAILGVITKAFGKQRDRLLCC
jgi:uncharacterized membrane protein YczE